MDCSAEGDLACVDSNHSLRARPTTDHRIDALAHIGLSTAAIALWIAWSLGVIGLVVGGVFGRWWLASLLVATICIFYLTICPERYLYDLENFMLSAEQQQRIGVPIRKH
jgi:hypothetical protein